ncbi:NAC domain-containing protein 2-like isoform X1 [Rhododendron vialii]|uniref:NAC domain-containing protein 2-like isoform X1 n=1 Tax=Rhododendron vialii TaxID=182163 RepID=UPI00265FF0FD|nr:NAC domain-containing protein 2-like isoform X1 [Rhododendron vialii]
MSFPPPPKRRLTTASKANTENSDHKAIPTKEHQQETLEQAFAAKVQIDSNFSHPEWKNSTEEFPPGYRFCPFDGELIVHYLQKKVNNESMPYNRIQNVNLYMHNPEYLADQYPVLGDDTWYFFSPRDRKYRKGKRPKRAAGDGYWKATGADKPVEHRGIAVGKKKSLVFYLGKPQNGDKTNWIMQEYTVDAPPRIKKDEYDMRLDDWVLCKIYKKAPGKSKKGGQEEEQQLDEQVAYTVTSPEEVADQCAKYDTNHVEKNYDYNSMCNGYIPPSRISALPPFSDSCFPNYGNFSTAAYHPQQQQQVVNYRVQSVGIVPPHVHPTQGFIMSKYNIQENFGSISTMDNLLAPQLPQLESMDTLSYYQGLLPNNPSTSSFL